MRQPSRSRGLVVIVVKAFTGGQERQPLQVPGSVGVRATSEVMSDPVHRSRRRQIQVGVDRRRDETGPWPDREAQEDDADRQTDEGTIEQPSVPTVGREILRVLGHEFDVARRPSIESDVRPLHTPPAEKNRGVRIAFDIGVGVMLAMDGDPLTRSDSRRDPDEQSTQAANRASEHERPMRQRAVQIDRRDEIGEHGHCEAGDDRGDEEPHVRNLASSTRAEDVREFDMDSPAETNRSALFEPVEPAIRERWMKFGKWDRVYFPQLVGITVDDVKRDYCRMSMPFRPELEQPMGIVHGGAIATLLDVVVVPAIGTTLEPDVGYSTVDMHVQYLNALVEETAVAEGWVVKRGRSLVFCDAEIVGERSGKTIARASLTYFLVPSRPYKS